MNFSNLSRLDEFKERLVAEVQRILETVAPGIVAEMLKRITPVTEFDDKQISQVLDHVIMISPRSRGSAGADLSRAYVLGDDDTLQAFDQSRFNTDAWTSAYDYGGAASTYLFCIRHIAPYVYIAFESICYREYGVFLPPPPLQNIKLSIKTIDECKGRLAGTGYYADLPFELRPMPERLRRADIVSRVSKLAARFAAYQGPTTVGAQFSDHGIEGDVEDKIRLWLRQFSEDQHIDTALQLLEKVKFLDRKDIVNAFTAFFKRHERFHSCTLCGFGSLKDSGAVTAYFGGDLGHTFVSRVASVQEVCEQEIQGPVVFVDDFCASGRQAGAIVKFWFANDSSNASDLGEERFALAEEQRTFLLNKPLAFVFAAAWRQGLDKLSAAFEELGVRAEIFAHITEEKIPFAFENCSYVGKSDAVEAFKEECRRIGGAILESRGASAEKIPERALGYGNRGMLLVLPYNVPTQTLTCLREEGLVGKVPWVPIFRRRTKK